MHFLDWKCTNFDKDFAEICSLWSKYQYSSIGSDNGLAPARRQAIIWTNDAYFTDAYMHHLTSTSYYMVHIPRHHKGELWGLLLVQCLIYICVITMAVSYTWCIGQHYNETWLQSGLVTTRLVITRYCEIRGNCKRDTALCSPNRPQALAFQAR